MLSGFFRSGASLMKTGPPMSLADPLSVLIDLSPGDVALVMTAYPAAPIVSPLTTLQSTVTSRPSAKFFKLIVGAAAGKGVPDVGAQYVESSRRRCIA